MEKALETKDMTIMIADIGVSLANALRRSSSEIPILAIDEVDIYQNDSALTDEILAHRIGLVPLKNQKTKKDKFVELKLKVSAKEPTYVLSKELQGDIVFDEVPLVYIDKGQSIEVVGKARQGLGKDHAKFSPGLVYYYHLSDVKVSKDGEKNLELAELHPEVFENKSGKLVVKNSWACNFDQEDIEIRVYNSDLGIDELLEIGDVDSFDSESISFEFTIPEGMEESWYELEFTVQEDGDVFENDYTDDDAVFNILLDVGENCALAQAFVSASLDEGGKAGKELIVRATIKNTGTKSTSYLVNAVGYVEWASLINVDPSTITLEAGQSADVLIALKVNGDVSGERLFNIEVLSEGELVVSQPLSVSVEKALIGDLFGDNGLLTALIIGIALILVIIIIVLAIRVARR